jgi:hypothetical protein
MAGKRSLPQETPNKRRRLSPDGLAPPAEMHILSRSPSPESGVRSWTQAIRGTFSNIGGGNKTTEVINGATPKPYSFLTSAYATIGSQLPRLQEDIGLGFSLIRTKLVEDGVVDDKRYEVSAHGRCEQSCIFLHLFRWSLGGADSAVARRPHPDSCFPSPRIQGL